MARVSTLSGWLNRKLNIFMRAALFRGYPKRLAPVRCPLATEDARTMMSWPVTGWARRMVATDDRASGPCQWIPVRRKRLAELGPPERAPAPHHGEALRRVAAPVWATA